MRANASIAILREARYLVSSAQHGLHFNQAAFVVKLQHTVHSRTVQPEAVGPRMPERVAQVVRGAHAHGGAALRDGRVNSGGKRQRGDHGGLRVRCCCTHFLTSSDAPQHQRRR